MSAYIMSSFIRSYGQRQQGLSRFVKPESPCYYDSVIDDNRLFPFTFNSGILDISYDGNNFKTRMVDISGNGPNDETATAVSILGGARLVTELGGNFKAYIRSWREGTIDPGSPIEVYTTSHVVRVQEADLNNINANSSESYLISTKPPASDNYIAGNEVNNYRTTFVFKTPLTFTIIESGVTKYITFRTVFDQE